MKMWIKSGGLLLVLMVSVQWALASPFVREASFQRIFDGNDFFDSGDLGIGLSTMSDQGNLVAFYGTGAADGYKPHLLIHNFDSTGKPVEVSLPARVGSLRTNTGLTSNADGSRIFFVADDALDNTYGNFLFCMLDTTTNTVTVLLEARPSDVELPQDFATDANGNYLYFNESDTGYRNEGDLWRIHASGGAVPELVILAADVAHPSGGFGRFLGEFDVSDDGNTIAFILDGWQTVDDTSTADKELFVLTGGKEGSIKNLTNIPSESDNGKRYLRLSGDGSTIVYSGSETGSFDLMTTTSTSLVNEQRHLVDGFASSCNKPGITTDGSVVFSRMTSGTASGFLIRSDGSDQLKMDTYSSGTGIVVDCTSEGVHLSGDGNRVFFKARPYVESIGDYVISLYTGIFNNKPWPGEVPSITSVSYPAPLSFGINNPEDFPPFKVGISVSDPQGLADVYKVAKQLLRFNGYPDNGGYGPIRVYGPSEVSAGSWESDGYRGYQWPVPPEDTSSVDYYDDPLEIEYARFSVKDLDGNVAYRDVILQAAEGGCSGTGAKELKPDDMAEDKDVSCITDGLIETVGEVIVKDGVVLYLSGSGVYLNGGLGNFFKVQAGAEIIIR